MLKYALLASAVIVSAPVVAQDKPKTTASAPGREALPPSSAATPEQATPAPTDQVAATPATPADPAMAEQKPADPATPGAPVGDVAAATPGQQAPEAAAPASDVAAATPAPAAPAAGQPVNQAAQVAQVVNAEFPSYDKDSDGKLSASEFGAWMVALKSASDPKATADNPDTKTWVGQAFATADKDKNSSITKAELTGFLTQG